VVERSPILNQQRRLAPLAILAAGLAALAVLIVVYHDELAGWIGGDRDATGSGDAPVAFYTCPMDPSVESDHPGPCPICGMALTPVSREERRSGVVRVAPAARARLGVVVARVELRPLVRRVVASGEVLDPPHAAADRASIAARVYRGDAREVQPGQAVHVSAPELPLTQFTGTVESPRPGDAPGELRFAVDDPGHALRPGMRVGAQLEVELSARLVVPAEAVVYAGSRRIVFVEHGNGRFEPRTPKLGITAAGLVEVLDGLAAGESVVVTGTFLLAAESRLRSDGSLWSDLVKPGPIKPIRPAPASATPEGSGW
jgi:hypothetical protein